MNEQLSDRELDALVAEKITLWTPIPGEDGWQSPDGSHRHWPGPPEYSTKIADAMEVVEKMRERGFFPQLWAAQVWNVEFWSDEKFIASANEDSLSRAICLAALAAINGVDPRANFLTGCERYNREGR